MMLLAVCLLIAGILLAIFSFPVGTAELRGQDLSFTDPEEPMSHRAPLSTVMFVVGLLLAICGGSILA